MALREVVPALHHARARAGSAATAAVRGRDVDLASEGPTRASGHRRLGVR